MVLRKTLHWIGAGPMETWRPHNDPVSCLHRRRSTDQRRHPQRIISPSASRNQVIASLPTAVQSPAEHEDGPTHLEDETAEFKNGSAELDDVPAELVDGPAELEDGSAEIDNGPAELDDGPADLEDAPRVYNCTMYNI